MPFSGGPSLRRPFQTLTHFTVCLPKGASSPMARSLQARASCGSVLPVSWQAHPSIEQGSEAARADPLLASRAPASGTLLRAFGTPKPFPYTTRPGEGEATWLSELNRGVLLATNEPRRSLKQLAPRAQLRSFTGLCRSDCRTICPRFWKPRGKPKLNALLYDVSARNDKWCRMLSRHYSRPAVGLITSTNCAECKIRRDRDVQVGALVHTDGCTSPALFRTLFKTGSTSQ